MRSLLLLLLLLRWGWRWLLLLGRLPAAASRRTQCRTLPSCWRAATRPISRICSWLLLDCSPRYADLGSCPAGAQRGPLQPAGAASSSSSPSWARLFLLFLDGTAAAAATAAAHRATGLEGLLQHDGGGGLAPAPLRTTHSGTYRARGARHRRLGRRCGSL
jgi:hypothetical protein